MGGGYPEPESGLSKIALEWMAGEAARAGLLIDRSRFDRIMGRVGGGYAPADPDAPMHHSMRGLWPLAEFVPKKRFDPRTGRHLRRPNLFARRPLPSAPLVHEAAFVRSGYPLPPRAVLVRTDPMPLRAASGEGTVPPSHDVELTARDK